MLLVAVLCIDFKEPNAGKEANPVLDELQLNPDPTQADQPPELQKGWKLKPMTEEDLVQGARVLVNHDHAYELQL